MNILSPSEAEFHPHSFADSAGRVFRWNGQVYRGITSHWLPVLERLSREGILQELASQGLLIETERVPLGMEGFEAVVRHRTVPFVSYPQEWCPAMLQDAVLLMVRLAIQLSRHGFTLKDAHPWNVLFDGCRPVYVDLTSITEADVNAPWPGLDEFSRYCLRPLILMANGQEKIARLLQCEDGGVTDADFTVLMRGAAMANPNLRVLARALFQKTFRSLAGAGRKGLRGSATMQLEELRARIESLGLEGRVSNRPPGNVSLASPEGLTASQRMVHGILSEARPATVLDVGSGNGWYSKLAAQLGGKVVTLDTDGDSVLRLYDDTKRTQADILPLVSDFTKPTPGRGLLDHWFIAGTKRLQCDMVIALDVIHSLVFRQNLNFDQIVEGLSLFSKRWVLVEFVLQSAVALPDTGNAGRDWYTRDNFTAALKKRFGSVRSLSGDSASGDLLLCEKTN